MKIALAIAAVAMACASVSGADDDGSGWTAGTSGGILLPGNGNSVRRAAAVSLRTGYSFGGLWDIEAEAFCAPHAATGAGGTGVFGGSVQGLAHFSVFEAYDRLFGCERFDPFVLGGISAATAGRHAFADDSHRTAAGPVFGIGAFYHLSDAWRLRADARAQLCCDSPCGMLYSVSVGLDCSLGGGK